MRGVVSGDSNDGGPLVMPGQTSTWVVVRTTEDISSWTGKGMRTLPDGGDVPDAAGRIDCTKLFATSTGAPCVIEIDPASVTWAGSLRVRTLRRPALQSQLREAMGRAKRQAG